MASSNIINAVFGSGLCAVTTSAFRANYGMALRFSGIDLPTAFEVDFSNYDVMGRDSITAIGQNNEVQIPDDLWDSGLNIYAYVYLHPTDDSGVTVYTVTIPVLGRPNRTDEQPTPHEQSVIEQAISALNDAVEQTAADVETTTANAQAAAQSEANAATSERSAAASAGAALASQNAAESASQSATESALASAESARNAANSESQAAQSATSAQESAEQAEQSAQSISGDVERAEQAATTATGKATEAATSATTANGAAQTATGKAAQAEQSATAAANSASAAATSASNAAASATAAQTAKTAAETAQGKAEDAQAAAEAAAQSVSESAAQIAKNTDNFASAFSASTTYAIGDYCIHEGTLYKFTSAHTGAWSDADVEETDVCGEVSELKSALSNEILSVSKQNCLEMIPLCNPVVKEHNGVTFTPSADGYTFVSTGTPSGDYRYIIFKGQIGESPFVPGGKYRVKFTAPDKAYFQLLSGDDPIINTLSFTGEKDITIPNDVTAFTVRIYCLSSAAVGTYNLSVVNERAEDYIEKNMDYKSTLGLVDFSWDKIFIESGALSSLTGEGSVNYQRLRTEFFFACKGGTIQSLNGQKFMVCRYSDPSESAFIDGVGFGTSTYTMPGDGFYRIATRTDTEPYFMTTNDFVNNIVVNAKIAISRNKRKIKYGKDEVCPYYYIDSTGAIHTSATLGCTSYLPIKGAKRISLTFMQMTTSNDYGLAFYDSNKTFISFIRQNIDVGSSGSFPYKTYDVPSDAEYIRVTSFINTNETAKKNNFYMEFVTEEMGAYRPYQSGYFFFSREVNQAVNQYWIDDDVTELDYSPADTTGVIALPSNYSADGDPVPVIMYFHGFSHYVYMDNWGSTDTFRTQKQHWLDMGFAVMDCNGGRNNNKEAGYTSGGSIQYVNGYKQCWEYIKKNYNVAPKVYISGGSAGGIAAINYCLWYAEDVRAACLLSPWTDLYTLSWQQGIVAQIKEYLGMGNDYDSDKAIGFDPAVRMITIGNNKYLPGWHIPTKVLVGSTETATAIYGCLVPFVTALRNAGETVNLRVLDGATHTDVVSGGISYIDTEVGNWFKSM